MAPHAKLKCIGCGKILSGSDSVWCVRYIDGEAHVCYAPCCSSDCALKQQSHSAAFLKSLLDSVQNQSFQKMSISMYYGDAKGEQQNA